MASSTSSPGAILSTASAAPPAIVSPIRANSSSGVEASLPDDVLSSKQADHNSTTVHLRDIPVQSIPQAPLDNNSLPLI
ncbi:hypothetical protein Cni_G19606 [Canna indica]|uniref:Uncharacterized protein n=1 Tax=Canna indica TaxID=4628 RepID=A0AAQ3KS00_9LILI|nr:hypothetical protein Cni_G19606 [Canna indica]